MTFNLNSIELTCFTAGADVLTADDPYVTMNNRSGSVRVLKGGIDERFFEMETGDRGTVPNLLKTFDNSLTISLFDADVGQDVLSGFEGGDDFIGSTTFIPTGNELAGGQFEQIVNLVGGGSSYQMRYNFTKLGGTGLKPLGGIVLKPRRGAVASQDGGVMQGSNTDGTLIGRSGKDIVFGNNGDDILVGGANDDVLNGGKGDDIIFGDKGKDTLSGGAGNDIFVLAPRKGFDIIKDFHKGDLLGLDNSLQFKDLTLVNQSKGMVVKAGSEQLAFLQGVHQLSASDFTQIDLSNLNGRVQNDFAALTKAA